MISEKKLKKWRKEALIFNSTISKGLKIKEVEQLKEANIKIIEITQELLDQYLINKSIW